MNTRYIIFSVLFVVVAAGLLFLPERYNYKQTPPEVMLKELTVATRYLSTDEVAAMIINHDPSLVLVDVRDVAQYQAFTLEGAINIPLADILDEEYSINFDRKERDIVFFSNDDINAEKAWMICRRAGYKNLYVMKGGLNIWAVNIMNPPVPMAFASSEEIDLYHFRRAACQYFVNDSIIGSAVTNPPPSPVKVPEPVNLQRKVKKTAVEGGC